MRYAPDESNTEKKKMYFFKKGLSTRLKVALSGHTCYTLREMVNKALEMQRDRLEADAQYKEKKCWSESSSRGPAPRRPRAHVPPPSCPRTAQGAAPAPSRGGGTHTANYHRPTQSCPVQSTSMWKATALTTTGIVPFACFNCGQPGHKAAHYPAKTAPPSAPASTMQAPSQDTLRKPAVGATRGGLTHLTAQDA